MFPLLSVLFTKSLKSPGTYNRTLYKANSKIIEDKKVYY